jgi:hypothetical protein
MIKLCKYCLLQITGAFGNKNMSCHRLPIAFFKGTVARDFRPPFFSSKVLTLDSDAYPDFFQIWFQIRGVI